jgi:hypothetical protein
MKSRDDVIAQMLRWSQDFIEQTHRVFGGLPICPFAKAARLRQSIRFEVLSFSAADPFEPDGRVMTLIGEFLGDEKLETLFVIHPEPERIGARALEAWVARLNTRLATCAVTRDLQVFEAHPGSEFCIGGLHTRRSPYPSFQVLRRSLLKDASDALLGSSYYDHFTPEMLRAVGMPHDNPSTSSARGSGPSHDHDPRPTSNTAIPYAVEARRLTPSSETRGARWCGHVE